VKNALKVHTLNGDYLKKLLLNALRQGKDARCIVRFEIAGVEADITLRFFKRQ
jgi:hypothetical protein